MTLNLDLHTSLDKHVGELIEISLRLLLDYALRGVEVHVVDSTDGLTRYALTLGDELLDILQCVAIGLVVALGCWLWLLLHALRLLWLLAALWSMCLR